MNNKEHIQQYINECCNDLNRLLSMAYETENPLDYIERYAYGTYFRRSALEMMNEIDVEGQRLRFKDVVTDNKTEDKAKQQKPLPEGVPDLPEGYVYLGITGDFSFSDSCRTVSICNMNPRYERGTRWSELAEDWRLNIDGAHYAAPADSEIAKLNGLA